MSKALADWLPDPLCCNSDDPRHLCDNCTAQLVANLEGDEDADWDEDEEDEDLDDDEDEEGDWDEDDDEDVENVSALVLNDDTDDVLRLPTMHYNEFVDATGRTHDGAGARAHSDAERIRSAFVSPKTMLAQFGVVDEEEQKAMEEERLRRLGLTGNALELPQSTSQYVGNLRRAEDAAERKRLGLDEHGCCPDQRQKANVLDPFGGR